MQFDLKDIAYHDQRRRQRKKRKSQMVLLVDFSPTADSVNLENLVFDQGNHLMTNPSVKLPQGSTRAHFKGYEEIHVLRRSASRIQMTSDYAQLPSCQNGRALASEAQSQLNRIQTKCYPTASRTMATCSFAHLPVLARRTWLCYHAPRDRQAPKPADRRDRP